MTGGLGIFAFKPGVEEVGLGERLGGESMLSRSF